MIYSFEILSGVTRQKISMIPETKASTIKGFAAITIETTNTKILVITHNTPPMKVGLKTKAKMSPTIIPAAFAKTNHDTCNFMKRA